MSQITKPFLFPALSQETDGQQRNIIEEIHNLSTLLPLSEVARESTSENLSKLQFVRLSIFNLCDSTEDQERELDQVKPKQKSQQKAFQTVNNQNKERWAILWDKICSPQANVEGIRIDTLEYLLHAEQI